MARTRAQKEQSLAGLNDKLSRAKSVVFADYRGLTTAQLSDLRKKLREVAAEFTITKNTLLEKSLALGSWNTEVRTFLEGPTATLFAYEDQIAPVKVLAAFAKTAGLVTFKGGFLAKTFLSPSAVQQLASLPNREVILSQVVGTLSAPLYGLLTALQWNTRQLVGTLKVIGTKK